MRSSGSAAAIAVSHAAASSVLPLGLEHVGVGGREPQRSGSAASSVSGSGRPPSAALEHQPRGARLAEVQAGAGLDDAELDGLLGVGVLGQRLGDQAQRDVGRGPAPARSRRARPGSRWSPLIRR